MYMSNGRMLDYVKMHTVAPRMLVGARAAFEAHARAASAAAAAALSSASRARIIEPAKCGPCTVSCDCARQHSTTPIDRGDKTCWSCKACVHKAAVVCRSCKHVMPLDPSINYFSALEMCVYDKGVDLLAGRVACALVERYAPAGQHN